MSHAIEVILNAVVETLCAAILGLSCGVIKYALSNLKVKIHNEKLNNALDDLSQVVEAGIYYAEQTVVKSFKENGGWTEEAKQQAKTACQCYITENLTAETTKLLTDEFNTTLTQVISNQIEATLGKMHDRK